MISSNKVNKLYGGFHALVDVTGHVSKGEVIVICGPSGSGKSTLIRTLNRLEEIQSGSLAINGQDIHEKGLDVNRFSSHIGFVFHPFNLFPHLTALKLWEERRFGKEVVRSCHSRLPPYHSKTQTITPQ